MATAVKTYQQFIGGEWIDSTTGETEPDINPASEASLIMCALVGALVQRFIGSDFSGESETVVSNLKSALLERLKVPS